MLNQDESIIKYKYIYLGRRASRRFRCHVFILYSTVLPQICNVNVFEWSRNLIRRGHKILPFYYRKFRESWATKHIIQYGFLNPNNIWGWSEDTQLLSHDLRIQTIPNDLQEQTERQKGNDKLMLCLFEILILSFEVEERSWNACTCRSSSSNRIPRIPQTEFFTRNNNRNSLALFWVGVNKITRLNAYNYQLQWPTLSK